MNIQDLKTSISHMNREQALNLVLERRDSRITPKKDPSKKSSKTEEPMPLDELINLVNPEQAQDLYEKFKEQAENEDGS